MGNGNKSIDSKIKSFASSSSWYQGPKSRLEYANAGKAKASVENMKTAIEFAVVSPVFKVLGGIAKGSKLLGGITKFADKFASRFGSQQKTIPTLTRKGVKNIPADKFKGTTYFRAEDAYIGQPGAKISKAYGKTGGETHNWFTKHISHIKDTYLPHVKDAALQGRSKKHTFYLPPGSLKRGITVNLSPGMSRRFSRPVTNPGSTANIMSGGVGKFRQPGEIIIPKAITKKIRKGEVPYANVFVGRTLKEMMKQFMKKTPKSLGPIHGSYPGL